MERFKDIERETKTKAFSKEGLSSGTKLDPAEKERYETTEWLNGCLDTLNLQIDQFEAEIEKLGTGKKKKSRDTADQIEEYQALLEKHRDHVQKLETLLRMLDNDNVNIDQVS
jgi:CCR4-NOT transcription complex subunit 3